MRRRMFIAGVCLLLVILLLVTRSALAPRWESAINSMDYVAYSDGPELVLCARGLIGNSLNPLLRIAQRMASDQHVTECVYLDFESPPAPGNYSLSGTGHSVSSGTGEPRTFEPLNASSVKALWFERTCFCRDEDTTVQFGGTLELRSLEPLSGTLKLSFMGPRGTVDIDARLASFDSEPVSELRRRETFRRKLSR